MANAPLDITDPVIPGPEDRELAMQSSQKLAALFAKKAPEHPVEVSIGEGEAIVLPFAAIQLLMQILGQMAQGNAVTIIPIHASLTTQQAADFLNVSRPFLISLLEKGKIPFDKVGTHRRIKAEELLKYQLRNEEAKKRALDELVKQAQELDMGY